MRVAAAAAGTAEVLYGLQKGVRACNLCQLRAQPRNDVIRGNAPHVQRFEINRDIGGCAAAATGTEATGPNGARDRVHRRVRLDDGGDLLELGLHQLKRARRIAADAAPQLTGILLRKQSFGDHDIEVNIQPDGREENEQHDAPVAQRPVERARVIVAQMLEIAFESARESRRHAVEFGSQQQRTHHRRRGERNHQRDQDRHRQGHGEFDQYASENAANQDEGREYRHQRQAHGEHGESDFLRALECRAHACHARFDVPRGVLHDHDRIVDDEACGNGEGHQRKIIERII